MAEVKTYSPSAIKTYSECPIKFELHYIDRLVPKEAGRMFWGGVAGDGFNTGVGAYLKNGHCQEEALQQAETVMINVVNNFTEAGGLITQEDYESVLRDVQLALKKWFPANPFIRWTDIQTEVMLPPQYGNPRLDIIGRDEYGVWSFADTKFKRNLATEYVDKTVDEYRYDWQFLHYAYSFTALKNEPTHAYLHLVRLKSAWQAQLFEFVYKPEILHMVRLSLDRWSEAMSLAANRGAALGTTHDTKFGPCPYKAACLQYMYDETLMKEKYITLKRLDDGKDKV